MGQKVTPQMIDEMMRLYAEIGTYSGVAKAMGLSPGTATRYIKERKSIKTYTTLADLSSMPQPKPIEDIKPQSIITFSNLTAEEKASYDEWIKEFEQ